MYTTAIIVTYGDRFRLLEEVIHSCLKENVSKIIVIDNDSHKKSKIKLQEFSKLNKDKIKIIWNDSNLGSAKAFKQGLKEVNNRQESEYIWLLDDDNRPKEKSLKILKDYWAIKPLDVHALLSYRPDRNQYKQAIIVKDPKLVLGWENSFNGFHIFEKFSNLFNERIENININIGEIAYAPYGGMFFHVSILEEIGYPDEDFFLYSDDHDWTYRITKANKKIYLVLDSVVEDIETSWALSDKRSSVFNKIKKGDPFRIYYTIRNRTLFEKKYLVKNAFSYRFNRLLFSFILFCYCFNSDNYKVFSKAIYDADNNILEHL